MGEGAEAERREAGCSDVGPSTEVCCGEERQEQDGSRAQGEAVREVERVGGVSEQLSGDCAVGAKKRACRDDQRGRETRGEEAGQGERVEGDKEDKAEGEGQNAEDQVGPGPTALPETGEDDAEEEFKDQWVCPEGELREVKVDL